MAQNTKKELPEHLAPLGDIIDNYEYLPGNIDMDNYAQIAFDIVKASEGDKEALKNISQYIQIQHSKLKNANEKLTSLRSEISSWLCWAENWTVKKGSK